MGEESTPQGEQEEERDVEELRMERLLKTVKNDGPKVRMDLPVYLGSLNGELLDWIGDMYKYFDFEEIPKGKQVKLARSKLKGHASLWWDYIQDGRKKKGKPNISSWDRMMVKLKGKFLPSDYAI